MKCNGQKNVLIYKKVYKKNMMIKGLVQNMYIHINGLKKIKKI